MITSFRRPNNWLGPRWACNVEWNGIQYPNLQLARYAAQCQVHRDSVELASMGDKTLVWLRNWWAEIPRRDDWHLVEKDVTYQLVASKFQDPELANRLRQFDQIVAVANEPVLSDAINKWRDQILERL